MPALKKLLACIKISGSSSVIDFKDDHNSTLFFMLQIYSQGLLFKPSNKSTSEFRLSTSKYPAVVLIPNNFYYIILHHRIVTSDNISTLGEIDTIITEFNSDLNGFNSTLALVVTWQVCM